MPQPPLPDLLTQYKADIAAGKLTFDSQQVAVIAQFQSLLNTLARKDSTSFLARLFSKNTEPRGIYLWGTVGSGKTHLMDLFFKSLPTQRKQRFHFHHFMKSVNDDLTALQGHPDPLRLIARRFSMQANILCFDEFVVNDIADAMLLGRLMAFLFERNVILVATSNRPPDDLYKDGLQRERFLPAIEAIKQHCDVIELSATQDYRWRALEQGGVYFTPLNDDAHQRMQQCFDLYAHGSGQSGLPLIIAQRPIATISLGKFIVWFDFNALCAPPRSQVDYLAIAQQFSVILISNLPVIPPDDESTACYWIELIDILYDNQIMLILSAEVPLQQLYPAGKKAFEFERTLSRLIEMQSTTYLQKK